MPRDYRRVFTSKFSDAELHRNLVRQRGDGGRSKPEPVGSDRSPDVGSGSTVEGLPCRAGAPRPVSGTRADCRNCGGDGYSLEGGCCPACAGSGKEPLGA